MLLFIKFTEIHHCLRTVSFYVILDNRASIAELIFPPPIALFTLITCYLLKCILEYAMKGREAYPVQTIFPAQKAFYGTDFGWTNPLIR